MRFARFGYLWLSWLFIGSVIVQVFLAGLGLFAGAENFKLHATFGFSVVHLLSLIMLVVGAIGRVGGRNLGLVGFLFILLGVQVSLPGLRTSLPLAAALHPVNALLIFWLGIQIARRARLLLQMPDHAVTAMTEPAPATPRS